MACFCERTTGPVLLPECNLPAFHLSISVFTTFRFCSFVFVGPTGIICLPSTPSLHTLGKSSSSMFTTKSIRFNLLFTHFIETVKYLFLRLPKTFDGNNYFAQMSYTVTIRTSNP